MKVKLTSVYDEGAIMNTSLIGAKGFAVLIEADGQKILFDTGRRGRYLLHNFMFLDIKSDQLDKVVISHGHSEHVGGLADILEEREQPLEIFAPSSAIGVKTVLGAKGLYIPDGSKEKATISEVKDWTELSEHVFISRPMDIGNGKEEAFMVVLARDGPIVIAACSHCGAEQILEEVKTKFGKYPKGYVGGVQIGKKEKQKAENIAIAFSDKGCTELHLNHCTGVNGMMYLRTNLGLKGVSDFYVGEVLEYYL